MSIADCANFWAFLAIVGMCVIFTILMLVVIEVDSFDKSLRLPSEVFEE